MPLLLDDGDRMIEFDATRRTGGGRRDGSLSPIRGDVHDLLARLEDERRRYS